MVPEKDRKIIRELAGRYSNIAKSDKNTEKIALYKAVNDLKMIRPVVIIDELPWHEMNIDGELDAKCESDRARAIEWHFRAELFKQKHFPCDMYLTPYYPIYKHGGFGGMRGIAIDEKLIYNPGGGVAAHEYHDQLKTEEDLEKLNWVPGGYDRAATMEQFSFVADIIGDIMPVKVIGHNVGMGLTMWDDVSQYRGVAPLLADLAERPEFMHKIARKLTDGYIKSIGEAVKYNLLGADYPLLHCSPAFTNDLAPIDDYDNIKPENVWGRGVAQIFGDVSPAMHDEFDTQYQIEATRDFGLVYYGCCERLDNKIHILKQMKNLRKISITPWSNINTASEIIGRDYEMSVKMNPANVGAGFDEGAVRDEFAAIISAAKKNGCSFDLVLKDISTVAKKPSNLFKWAQIAMEAAMDY